MGLTAAQKKLLKKMLEELDDDERESLQIDNKPKRQSNFPLGKRPNKFENSADSKKFKSDTAIDKLLSGDNERTDRRGKATKVEAVCNRCGKRENVNPIFAYFDNDARTWNFTCDRCSK